MQSLWSAQQIQGGRDYQEDFYAVVENSAILCQGQRIPLESHDFPASQTLYLLADGMGGMGHGDYAAATVIDAFIHHYLTIGSQPIEQKLHAALIAANGQLRAIVEDDRQYDGMGCTVVCVVVDCATNRLCWISVGDSPLWLYRQGKLVRLNQKHTWRELLKNDSAAADALEHPLGEQALGMLSSAVDGGPLNQIDLPESSYPVEHGDLLLLASDGVETLSIQQIESTLKKSGASVHLRGSMEAINRILNQARAELIDTIKLLADPDQDNTTVILVAFIEHAGALPTLRTMDEQ